MIMKLGTLRLIEKPFKCIMCGDKFKTQEELSKHQHLFCTGGW